jgi:5-aminolevulinate synthase
MGIRHRRAQKLIFAHNDLVDLDRKLAALDPSRLGSSQSASAAP